MGAGLRYQAPRALTLLSEQTLTAPATSFSDILVEGETQGGFLIEFCCYEAAGGGDKIIQIRMNGAATVGNRQGMTAQNILVSASNQAGTSAWIDLLNSGWTLGDINIPRSKSGTQVRAMFGQTKLSNGSLNHIGVDLTTPAANVAITSIGLESTGANTLAAGSILRIWKKG